MADRQWRRSLSRTTRRPTQVEAPQQVVFDDDSRLTDARVPVGHTHPIEELSNSDGNLATHTEIQTWIEKFRTNHPELTIPDFP